MSFKGFSCVVRLVMSVSSAAVLAAGSGSGELCLFLRCGDPSVSDDCLGAPLARQKLRWM